MLCLHVCSFVIKMMRLRCHPVRIIRYCLLLAGGLALITGVWQVISKKPHSGSKPETIGQG